MCKKSYQKALVETNVVCTSSTLDNTNTPYKTRKNKKIEAQYIKGTKHRVQSVSMRDPLGIM